jgi:hypothetical protein
MNEALGTLILDGEKIILSYYDGYKETFERNKPNYSEGSQWIIWNEEKYFLKQD